MHEAKSLNKPSTVMNIAKFAPGNGSIIKLKTLIDAQKSDRYYNYTISAAFDQGSVMGEISKPISPISTINANQHLISIVEYIVTNPVLVASELAIIPVSWFILRWWTENRYRKQLISKIVNSLMSIRASIKIDEYYVSKPFSEFDGITAFLKKFADELNINDRLLLDDLTVALLERIGRMNKYVDNTNKILPGVDRQDLSRYNQEFLMLINNVLEKVDWLKYKKR